MSGSLPKGFGSDKFPAARQEVGHWKFSSNWSERWHIMLLIGLFGLAASIAFWATMGWYLEMQTPWEMKKVSAILQGALDTNNVERKVTYIKEAVTMLESHHGNSEWWNPTANTDIDMTRRVLQDTALDVEKQIPIQDREQWMFLPHEDLNTYLNSEIKKGQQRILEYGTAWKYNAHKHPLFVFAPIFVIISMVTFIVGAASLLCGKFRTPIAVYYDGECPCGNYIFPPSFYTQSHDYYSDIKWDSNTCPYCNKSCSDNEGYKSLKNVKYARNSKVASR